MAKFGIMIAAAFLTIGVATSAGAIPAGPPEGLNAAIEEQKAVESVHCRPGRVHWHRWGWGTGCRRAYFGPRVYVAPNFYAGPRFYYGPRYRHGYWRHHW